MNDSIVSKGHKRKLFNDKTNAIKSTKSDSKRCLCVLFSVSVIFSSSFRFVFA
jgi:hypothetical protein